MNIEEVIDGDVKRLYPYEQTIWNTQNNTEKKINLIYCKEKRIDLMRIGRYCEKNSKGIIIPSIVKTKKHIMHFITGLCKSLDITKPNPVFYNIPDNMDRKYLAQIEMAMRKIRVGCLSYETKEKRIIHLIDTPELWVFTHTKPNKNIFYKNMWKIWELDEQLNLKKYNN